MNQKLFELFNFCGENHIDFQYEAVEDGKNRITHCKNGNRDAISIVISDPEDEHLDELIDNKIKEFKSLN
jgi:hypothetical protein